MSQQPTTSANNQEGFQPSNGAADLRRSERKTKGQRPERYGDWIHVGTAIPTPIIQNPTANNNANEDEPGDLIQLDTRPRRRSESVMSVASSRAPSRRSRRSTVSQRLYIEHRSTANLL